MRGLIRGHGNGRVKAVLLAGGRGERLRPLTDSIPKCLLPFGDEPLLGLWLRALARSGVADVLINLHHLADLVLAFLRGYRGPLRITTAYEPELLGSLGTLLANAVFLTGESSVLVCYADNLTNADLGKLIEFHGRHGFPATLGTFLSAEPHRCGIVETDASGVVVSFVEKPERPTSNVANAGLYVIDPRIIRDFRYRAGHPLDIGSDLMPRLVGRMKAFAIEGHLVDIGTPESYHAAQRLFAEHRESFTFE